MNKLETKEKDVENNTEEEEQKETKETGQGGEDKGVKTEYTYVVEVLEVRKRGEQSYVQTETRGMKN